MENTALDTHDLHALFAAIKALNLQDVHMDEAATSIDRLASLGMEMIEGNWN